MTSKAALDKQVVALVARWAHKTEEEISLETVINAGGRKGLGVDGADADDLIGFLSRGIGWPIRDFNWDDYFGAEVGWDPVSFLFSFFRKKERLPLTVAILSRKFFESSPSGGAERT